MAAALCGNDLSKVLMEKCRLKGHLAGMAGSGGNPGEHLGEIYGIYSYE